MKRYLQSFSIKKILLLALVVRVILLPLAFHSDLTTNSIWGIYARDFGLRGYYDWLNFGNYARPEYPPFSTLLFLYVRKIFDLSFSILWFLNVKLPLFPSGIVVWMDKFGYMTFLKLPGIISDIVIGFVIYRVTKVKKLAAYYLFNPATIYLSSLWGQTESFVSLFLLVGVLLTLQKRYIKGLVGLFISFLTKASGLPAFPIIIMQALKNKISFKKITLLILLVLLGTYIVGYFFTDHAPIMWMIDSYKEKFIVGPANLPFINLNAFNFWGLLLGFDRISDKSYSFVAWMIAIFFFLLVLNKFRSKNTNIFFALVMIFFASFMFLPRMHERYLFPIFVFFPFLLYKFPKFKILFFALSGIFLINLYHWWWVPNIPILVSLFSLELVIRGLSLINLGIFGYLLWKYQSS